MNYAAVFAQYEAELAKVGEEPEALKFTYMALKQLSMTDLILQLREPVSPADQALLADIARQLLAHRPAQYIIGQADFCGLSLKVDERVLIPRPETEELVALILAENGPAVQQVLDMGTGSGAIALALAQSRAEWQVTASDISAPALALAKENAQQNQLQVDFVLSDLFQHLTGKYDIIVSNPPYIAESDRHEVGVNVLASEPHLALFAAEEGLAIYRQLAEQAGAYLKPGGRLYLEIGYKQGPAVRDLLRQHFPGKMVCVHQDSFGKDRMVSLYV